MTKKRYDYRGPQYQEWRKLVLERDCYKCQMPRCRAKKRLQVHHILRYADAPLLRYTVSNGITLCSSCHYKIRNHELIYAQMFTEIAFENEKNK